MGIYQNCFAEGIRDIPEDLNALSERDIRFNQKQGIAFEIITFDKDSTN